MGKYGGPFVKRRGTSWIIRSTRQPMVPGPNGYPILEIDLVNGRRLIGEEFAARKAELEQADRERREKLEKEI